MKPILAAHSTSSLDAPSSTIHPQQTRRMPVRSILFGLLLLTIAAMPAVSGVTKSGYDGDGLCKVTLWKDTNFTAGNGGVGNHTYGDEAGYPRGHYWPLYPWYHQRGNFNYIHDGTGPTGGGIFHDLDNEYSSVEVELQDCSNVEVRLYDDVDFGGDSIAIGHSVSHLSSLDWNDRVSSIKLFDRSNVPACRLIMYEDADEMLANAHEGDKWSAHWSQGDANGFYSTSKGAGEISGIRFVGDCGNSEVVVWADVDRIGSWSKYRVADGASYDLVGTPWDDRILAWDVYFKSGPPVPIPPCSVTLLSSQRGSRPVTHRVARQNIGDVYSDRTLRGEIAAVGFGGQCGNSEIHLFESPDWDYTMPYRVSRFADGYDHNFQPTPWNNRTQSWTVFFNDDPTTPSVVPDVVNTTVAQGVTALEARWYNPVRADFADTDDPNLGGKIHSTIPAAGDALLAGETVYYVEWRSPLPYAPTAGFQLMPGGAIDIGAGGADYGVWVIGTNPVDANGNEIFYWDSGSWIQVPGGAARVDVGPDSQAWVVQNNGYIYHMENGNFVRFPGLAKDIGVGDNGDVWIIGTNPVAGTEFDLYRWNATTSNWDIEAGAGAVRIDVDEQGNPWVVQSGGQIYRYDGSGFVLMPGRASDISIGGNGDVWIIGTNSVADGPHDIWRWNESNWNWDPVPGGALGITVDVLGQPWIVQGGGSIYFGALQ